MLHFVGNHHFKTLIKNVMDMIPTCNKEYTWSTKFKNGMYFASQSTRKDWYSLGLQAYNLRRTSFSFAKRSRNLESYPTVE
jgi:hypothetical protein